MKLIVQRVSKASVEVNEKIVGNIDQGLMVLVGFGLNDTVKEADFLSSPLRFQDIYIIFLFLPFYMQNFSNHIYKFQFLLYNNCKTSYI